MSDIYMIFNDFNTKVYIGKAKYGAKHRWKEHIGYDLFNNQYIHKSMRKHGIEHFNYKIIETGIEEEKLNEREQYWIKYYNSKVPYGYNQTDGGDGGPGRKPLTEEQKEYNKKMREQGIVLGPEKNFEKYKQTEKYQKDIQKKCKKIKMIDIDTNEVLKIFNSIKEAVAYLNQKPCARVGLSNCANGKINTSYGYKWEWYN